ncbi:hypothetical protein LCGC14_0969890 [marine sediment metagenome]|uniref:Uncharacterized protein n=1 Tax=marine sediment metagenome TaxID=412755 RepID=A0A0F9NC19_9ZZZZ
MEWLTWYDLRKYSIVSIYVEKPRYNLHNPSEQKVIIDMLHDVNDYPPMKLVFTCHKVSGKFTVASVTNNLDDPSSSVKISSALIRELKIEKSGIVKNLLMMLTWS